MAIQEYEQTWDLEGVVDAIHCPCCGSEDFTHIPGMGLFCSRCNTKAVLDHTSGDPGYIVRFESDGYTWIKDAEQIIFGDVFVKLLGQRDPEVYYWSEPRTAEAGQLKCWENVTRDSEHDGERPDRPTLTVESADETDWYGGYKSSPCIRCERENYDKASGSLESNQVQIAVCDHCGLLYDVE